MQNSISLALYAQNVTILEDAFDRAMGDVVVSLACITYIRRGTRLTDSSRTIPLRTAFTQMGLSFSTAVSSTRATTARIC